MSTVKDEAIKLRKNIDIVYEAGRKDGQSEFWDKYQNNGNQTNYARAFAGVCWRDETYNPKYNMRPTNAQDMFRYSLITDPYKNGIEIDFSQCTNFTNTFDGCSIPRLGVIDIRGITGGNAYAFASANIVTIEKMIINDDGSTDFPATMFTSCTNLTNISFEGVIGKDLNLSGSRKLSYDSLINIITVLKDYSEDTSGTTHKITLGATNLAKLTEEEKAIMDTKGWTYA